jgi:acetylornithine deacetylase/succinyl-diaminopimelate desuccinylase-like protein
MLSNTATPTVLRAGYKTNVIPSEAEAEIDGRTLPAQTAADLLAEIRAVVEEEVEIEILRDMPPVETEPDGELWELMVASLRKHDPGAVPVPYLMPGLTDAKHWSRLGARCFGFMPLRLPDDGARFADLFHGNDERIWLDGLRWGTEVLYEVVREFITR